MDIIQIICIAVIIIIVAIFIAWKIYKEGLREVVIDLIVEAENRMKDNDMKFHTVVQGIIVKLPLPFSLIISTETIERLVQSVFNEIKVALDYGREKNN